ncbi:MAG TPA: hypothetical protein VIY56_04590 [Vicinamibacterales bacterium]
MNRVCLFVLCVSVLGAASCRMADGPLPDAKADDAPNQIGDLARDLGNVAAGHEEARQDFMEDLMVFVDLEDVPAAEAPIKALGQQVLDVVAATKVSEGAVVPLLEQMYVALTARQLSENQVKSLQDGVQGAATQLGVDDVKARALAAQVGIVQQAVTDRHRRWYEVF